MVPGNSLPIRMLYGFFAESSHISFYRYMMLILDRNEIYFVDRNFSCFKVNDISFVTAKNLNEHIKNTLVDGVGCIYL